MEAIERTVLDTDWITLILLFSITILAVAKKFYPGRFHEFIILFATNKYLMLKGKDPNVFHPFNLLFFGINIISVSLFIFLIFSGFIAHKEEPVVFFLQIATAYAALVLVKFFVEKIIADIFTINDVIDPYVFHKLTYRNFLAFILLPLNIAFVYAFQPSLTTLVWVLGFILILNILVLISFYSKIRRQIFSRWFYFIVYLCALEIAPYFILYKWFTMYKGF
ncbi:MAG TPA: DUF4271 domain-containing protein [Salinimicrobium sp.]|nr:DUF4271 domain-containing protein [Salinimicrobium sp.]